VHRARPRRSLRLLAPLAAFALVTAACADDDADAPADDQAAPEEELDPDEELDPEDMEELEDLLEGQEEMDLPDPNEHVEDGVFRGVGVMLPTPEGWELDEMSFAQGMVVAFTEDRLQTLAAQAVDTADIEEDLDYDQLVETSRDDLGGEPDADEEIEFAGADRAHLLRFDDLEAQEEGAPENTLLTIIADDGAGQLAMFNYVAPTEDYDEDTEDLLLSQGGFDPDSEPEPPMPVG
jgi:hypothetical protein